MKPASIDSKKYDIVILGGGVAGLSAAIYASRDGLKTLVVEGEYVSTTQSPGGALTLTESIENFPGYGYGETSSSGVGLIETIRAQALSFGTKIIEGRATSLELSENDEPAVISVSEYGAEPNLYVAKTVIIATGAVTRELGVPGERHFLGSGVSTCATCDAFFFKGKVVGVVGGGDTAVEDALFLTKFASKVHVFVRSDSFKTNSPDVRKLIGLDGQSMDIHWNTTVQEIIGETSVSGVKLLTDKHQSELSVDGLFVAVGRDPNTKFVQGSGIHTDDNGYITVDPLSRRVGNIDGGFYRNVFAAGDVSDWRYVQAITASGDAVKCALSAREFIG